MILFHNSFSSNKYHLLDKKIYISLSRGVDLLERKGY